MILRPPKSKRTNTPVPSTTLFRARDENRTRLTNLAVGREWALRDLRIHEADGFVHDFDSQCPCRTSARRTDYRLTPGVSRRNSRKRRWKLLIARSWTGLVRDPENASDLRPFWTSATFAKSWRKIKGHSPYCQFC